MGVCKTFYRAEQEQRRTHPRQHTEGFWNRSSKFKKVMDVVQNHQHQRDGLELGPVQPLFRQCIHIDSPFVGYKQIVTEKSVEILRSFLIFYDTIKILFLQSKQKRTT